MRSNGKQSVEEGEWRNAPEGDLYAIAVVVQL